MAQNLVDEILFLLQRFTWLSVLDLFLVTLIFFAILMTLRDTQAVTLLRGLLVLFIVLAFLATVIDLPAFSWLVDKALPAMLIAIPVVFAPEIRRGLERLGRAGIPAFGFLSRGKPEAMSATIHSVSEACARLSARRHGALIILQRRDSLGEYVRTGVPLNARVAPELLIQIFYPNTPLHDGAVIIQDERILAASCVMPLSASGVLDKSAERQMGLRHRAALGISEVSDSIAVVVSEQNGSISITHGGRMIRKLDTDRLEKVLLAFFEMGEPTEPNKSIFTVVRGWFTPREEKEK
jgi:diadenylate cyclase